MVAKFGFVFLIAFGLIVGCSKEEEKLTTISPNKKGESATVSDQGAVSGQEATTSYSALSPQQKTQAKELFLRHCSACHGERWRDDFEPTLEVQAVHDGKSISLRLSWADKRADTHAAKTEAFEDAVAVELYRGTAEPFLGMGAKKSAVDIWM